MSQVYEVNFDGLVGPTHHYDGLAYGNVASMKHSKMVSNPKDAALQGLAKMRLMVGMGLKQGILLPHPRPPMHVLHHLGFLGNGQDMLEQLANSHPSLFSALFSSSAMWAANSATVTSSSDAADQKVHITPANLSTLFHRAIETEFNFHQFQKIFTGPHFVVHPALPYGVQLGDEGAANHVRLCSEHSAPGLHLYVYGRSAFSAEKLKFPARQSLEASETIARSHRLATPAIFLQQNHQAIDQGIFHNDVIAVGNESVFLCHEAAYQDPDAFDKIKKSVDFDLNFIQVSHHELSLQEAVSTYLFNSQIVTLPDRSMVMILPSECELSPRARAVVDRILNEDNPIQRAEFIDCRQSMLNGGGPACLRLRVLLNEQELQGVNPHYLVDEHKIGLLESWVNKHYRDRLTSEDFLDPLFRKECEQALTELESVLS